MFCRHSRCYHFWFIIFAHQFLIPWDVNYLCSTAFQRVGICLIFTTLSSWLGKVINFCETISLFKSTEHWATARKNGGIMNQISFSVHKIRFMFEHSLWILLRSLAELIKVLVLVRRWNKFEAQFNVKRMFQVVKRKKRKIPETNILSFNLISSSSSYSRSSFDCAVLSVENAQLQESDSNKFSEAIT